MLADEPTGNLDSHTADEVFDAMVRLSASHGTAFVIVTHDQGVGEQCNRIVRMMDGQIIGQDNVSTPPVQMQASHI